MTTDPFPLSSGADPAEGTAAIVPVTPEMMDHAAHEAAERADTVAHEDTDAIPETLDHAPEPTPDGVEPTPASEADPASAPAAHATAMNENAAAAPSEGVAAAASGTLQAADLAFTHGSAASGSASHPVAGSVDNFDRYNAKVLEIATDTMSAAGELVSALLGATSITDAAAINADHVRRRLDALTTQGRELLLLAQRVAFDAMRPSGDGFRKP